MSEIMKIELDKIDSFKNHPFQVNNDELLKQLSESIKENGLLNPLTVRKKEDGRYELISGHRRKFAMELIGIKEANAYVKELSDDEATIEMVDSNMYRDKILPSEKAFAYKMKLDALKHQGKKLSPKGTKSHSVDEIDDTKTQIYRYVRLTNLIPELLQLVDATLAYKKTGKTNFKKWSARKCGCIEMVDIGVYNSCKHFCKYCYANFDEEKVNENYNNHDDNSSFLVENSKYDDIIKVRS